MRKPNDAPPRIGALEEWPRIVPPREWRRVQALVREHDELAGEIDRRYETGEVEGIEDLEQRAESLLETLDALYHHYLEGEPETGEGVSVEEQLAWAWNNPDAFGSREGWIANMRDVVETAAIEEGKRIRPTDEEIIAAAQDAAERRAALVRRYKAPKKKRGGSIGSPALRRWTITVETPDEPIETSVHMHEPDAAAHAERAIEGILERAMFQLEVFRDHLIKRFGDYYYEARRAAEETRDLLASRDVWAAVERWDEFQALDRAAEDGGDVGPPPLWPTVGRLALRVD